MKSKLKICNGCKKLSYIWKNRDGKKYCKNCAGVAISSPKPTAKQKPLPARSSKRIIQDREYSKLRMIYLKAHPMCHARLNGCTSNSTDVHHKRGRGEYLLDTSTFIALCRSCHQYLELHPIEAKLWGFSESRLSKNKETKTMTEIKIGSYDPVKYDKAIDPVGDSSGLKDVRDGYAVQLYYKEGSSDKVYNIEVTPSSTKGLYNVNFSYGRRGSALVIGSKTVVPVNAASANNIFNKLVKEKVSKGYKPMETSGEALINGAKLGGMITETRDIKAKVQLLNEIKEENLEKYLTDDSWCAQEKYDGRRRTLLRDKDKDTIVGTNRNGQAIPISGDLEDAVRFAAVGWNYKLDGEDLGEKVMIFDLMDHLGPYKDRYKELQTNFNLTGMLELAPTAWTTSEKRALLSKLKTDNAEGIVFKHIDGLYSPGAPASGGSQLKFKFYETASCIVSSTHPVKKSIGLQAYDEEGKLVNIGNATVYPSQTMPTKGKIVEVRYLYYFPEGGLFQPVLLGKGDVTRDDIDQEDCKVSKLKVKREELNEL